MYVHPLLLLSTTLYKAILFAWFFTLFSLSFSFSWLTLSADTSIHFFLLLIHKYLLNNVLVVIPMLISVWLRLLACLSGWLLLISNFYHVFWLDCSSSTLDSFWYCDTLRYMFLRVNSFSSISKLTTVLKNIGNVMLLSQLSVVLIWQSVLQE